MKKSFSLSNLIIFALLLITALGFLVPFIWTLLTSLKGNEEIYSATFRIFPSKVTFVHYIKVVTQMKDFAAFTLNTVSITFFSVIATVLFSAMTGYAFSKLEFVGKKIYFAFILLVLTVPYAVYLIPIYIMKIKSTLLIPTWDSFYLILRSIYLCQFS